MFELVDNIPQKADIKVIGVGGGGGNAVLHMIANQIEGVEFICANTDAQALNGFQQGTLLQLGNDLTKGLGAGAKPEVGRQAALEDKDRISEAIKGADMLFITAGMGGGTGTGAAPVVAEIARELGILTVAVVTRPFPFEGRRRSKVAEKGLLELAESVDSLITVPNEKLLTALGENVRFVDAFNAANDVLRGAVQGIADLIIRPGVINVDFADVNTVMSAMGKAMMGTGVSTGSNRAEEAAQSAINSPLLEDIDLMGAKGVLVNITASDSLTMNEFSIVGDTIEDFASEDAEIVIGTAIDPDMGDEIRVTVVVTGLGSAPRAVVDNGDRIPSEPDMSSAEKPIFAPNDEPAQSQPAEPAAEVSKPQRKVNLPDNTDPNYLDVPAFLRRQAD